MTDIMTLPEVAEYLRCSPSTIYRMVHRSQLPCFKVGRDWRFIRAAINAWINRPTEMKQG
jgi:excisionase family DNA binding protein